jgi:hypothetical protein
MPQQYLQDILRGFGQLVTYCDSIMSNIFELNPPLRGANDFTTPESKATIPEEDTGVCTVLAANDVAYCGGG